MHTTGRFPASAVLGAALTFLLSTTGCGTSIDDLCDDACDCEGCSDAQYDLCVETLESWEEIAEDFGCDDEFDDYIECLVDTATCVNRDYDTYDERCDHVWGSCGHDPYTWD